MRRYWRTFLATGTVIMMTVSLIAAPQQAWGQQKKDDKAVLEEVLDIMKEKGQISEEKYQELKERAKKEGAGKILAGFEGWTPYIKSVDGQHKIEFHGRVNFDLRAYESESRNLDANRSNLSPTRTDLTTKFLIRRARLGVDATFFKYLDFKVEGEFQELGADADPSPRFRLTDGYVELKYWPEFRVRGGQFKVPFSFEELTSSRFIDFVERSLVNNLVPARDVGGMLHGSLFGGILEYYAGTFNGTGQNNPELNDSKDYAGRVLVRPFQVANIPALSKFHIAGHATFGDQDVTPAPSPAPNNSLRGRTDARFVFFPQIPVRGDRLRYGFEAVYAFGPFGLYGEYVRTEEERNLGPGNANLGDLEGKGWYVAGTWFVTGEEKVHAKAPKVKPMNPRTGDWGALELLARYAQLEFDSPGALPGPSPSGGGKAGANKADALTVGFNWYLSPNVRMMFNFVQNWFENDRMTPITNSDTSWEIVSRLALWF
ncbi:MAG: OprO/OprP family phosphate-selective porin [Candidatus Methylomirabilaceae bacterium]